MRASFRGVDQCWSAVESGGPARTLGPVGSATSSSPYTRELSTGALSRRAGCRPRLRPRSLTSKSLGAAKR